MSYISQHDVLLRYLNEAIQILHNECVWCVDYTEGQYGLGVKGQGQIHLKFTLRLVKQSPFLFLKEGVNIWPKEFLLYAESSK